MIGIIFLFALFICVSSIFVPKLRTLALCIITTAIVGLIGIATLIGIFSH